MAELKFEITERIGVLSENAKGWTKEFNKVSWNEREPKYDKAILNGEEIEDDINEADIL